MNPNERKTVNSLLDVMEDGREFESLLKYNFQVDFVKEIRKSIGEIKASRHHPIICYVANVIKGGNNASIDNSDDLPFTEMVNSIDVMVKEIDIVLVTNGGLAEQVNNFVNTLRPRFDRVNFIVLNAAMSAGTIFIMSGDEIVMSKQSKFGPIDPQIPNKEGVFIPAQSILIALKDIQKRGEEKLKNHQQPDWSDIQILKNIDVKDLGRALSASNHSTEMVKEFLCKYKFNSWETHSNNHPVSLQEKEKRAEEIAKLLCDHSVWKSHGHTINRDTAWKECKLKITHAENIEGLDRAMRRMWALLYWIFENTMITKIFVSDNYCIIRQTAPIINNLRPTR